jgi:branched-subunit amino acid transport protein AzlD
MILYLELINVVSFGNRLFCRFLFFLIFNSHTLSKFINTCLESFSFCIYCLLVFLQHNLSKLSNHVNVISMRRLMRLTLGWRQRSLLTCSYTFQSFIMTMDTRRQFFLLLNILNIKLISLNHYSSSFSSPPTSRSTSTWSQRVFIYVKHVFACQNWFIVLFLVLLDI